MVLGIYFSGLTEGSKIDLNWKSKIENMLPIVNTWKNGNVLRR